MNEKKRGLFRSRTGFILACIGSAVGMGNIWMFPTRVSLYGGGSFILPYLLFVILIGSTGIIGEMALGRATHAGPVDAFGAMTERRGNRNAGRLVGMIPVVGSFCLAVGYTVVMGWILKYTVGSFTGSVLGPADVDGFAGNFGGMASEFGNNLWQTAALVIAFVILTAGISAGIERANKILMPLFFLMFVMMGIYVFLQPGSGAGYDYIFRIDPDALKDPVVWIFALGQAFFSLSIAGNGTVIYGSYLDNDENIPFSASRVALFDSLAAMLAALVIIPAMATTGVQLDQGGPGLMFIFLPQLFKGMPGGHIVCIVFFVAVLSAGLSSLINLYEAPIATVQELLGAGRVKACLITGGAGLAVSLLIQGIVSGWMDAVSIYICPLGAGLAGIMFFWVGGKDFVESQVNRGREKPIGRWFFPLCRYVFCPVCFFVLAAGAVMGGIG